MSALCWAYTIVRNEAKMLPWWLRWYSQFCERLVVYDDQSDDGTPDLARAAGAEIRDLPFTGLDDGEHVRFAESIYPEARGRALWVAWIDADEFVSFQGGSTLETLVYLRARGVRLPIVQGWQMYSDYLPNPELHREQLPALVTSGLPDGNYSKQIIFDPTLELTFGLGRHPPTAGFEAQPSPLRLLHFRFMGRQYYLERSARNYARLSDRAKSAGWGHATYPEHRDAEADMNEANAQKARSAHA